MGEHDDKVFLKRFSGIITGLVIVTILIIIIAIGYDSYDPDANPSRAAMAAERVQPVAGVRTELLAKAIPDQVAEAPEPEAQAPAADGDIDGAAVYVAVCQACHLSGAAGAPVPGTDAWAERAAKGLDQLTATAISGIGIMPAKGGRMDLSDEEVRAAVQHMLDQ
ncbi:MAG: c-type cytochrome [Xanthomonadales bacterium]|nr:c-type cytochrome [Xanthomonadales bacterium]